VSDTQRRIPAGRRSGVIAESLGGWLEEQRRHRLRREVVEGCQEMADVYLELERAYHPLEEEVSRTPTKD